MTKGRHLLACRRPKRTQCSRLPPSPAATYCLPIPTTRLSFFPNHHSQREPGPQPHLLGQGVRDPLVDQEKQFGSGGGVF